MRLRRKSNRYLIGLTPAGFGVLVVFFPGLLMAVGSGQKWMIATSLGAGLLLVFNAAATRVMLGCISIKARGPALALAGQPIDIHLEFGSPQTVVCVVNAANGDLWVQTQVPGSSTVVGSLPNRGVVTQVAVGIQTSNPFRLVAFLRKAKVDLQAPIHVGPAPTKDTVPAVSPALRPSVSSGSGRADPTGTRQFLHGDSYRDVHWGTTARTGSLKVRDRRAGKAVLPVAVAVDAENEDVLRVTYSVVGQLLVDGVPVDLTTLEAFESDESDIEGDECGLANRLVTAPVQNRRELVRRLARARIGVLPPNDSLGHAGLRIDSRGPWWQWHD